MDQPAAEEETFVLKTNIHSYAYLKKMEKLLQRIQGVRRILLHPTEIGTVTITGTIDPRHLMEILLENGIESEHVLEARFDHRGPNSPPNHIGEVDDVVMARMEALSKLKGLKTVVVSKNRVKLTYKEDEHVQDPDGKNGSCSNWHGNAVHNDSSDLHGNNRACSSRNQGMYTLYCHGCYSTNCRCKAQPESVAIGIPCPPPPYIPSAPAVPEFYPNSPLQEQTSDRRVYNDDNPTAGYFVLFLFCFLLLLIQAHCDVSC